MPTVAVHTHVFARLARSVAMSNGMPTLRQAFVPQPVVGRSPDELRAYVEGDDPVNNCSFMKQVIGGLTHPLDGEDLKGLSFDRSTPRLLDARHRRESPAAVHRESLDAISRRSCCRPRSASRRCLPARATRPTRWSGACGRRPFASSGSSRSRRWPSTPSWRAASPEYLPVILAMAASGVSRAFELDDVVATVALVNGPIRDEIGMNYRNRRDGARTATRTRRSAARTGCSRRTCRAARCRARPTWARRATS